MFSSRAAALLAVISLFTQHAIAVPAGPDQDVLSSSAVPLTSMDGLEDVRQKLKDAEIIPTVIGDFSPFLFFRAGWPSGERAALGNTVRPSKLQDAPKIVLDDPRGFGTSSHSGMTYVITLTDPDAPSRDDPKWSEMCHWIAAGASVVSDEAADGTTPSLQIAGLKNIVSYKPPGPPPTTGKHRYVFLAFIPANYTTDKLHLSKPSERKHWGGGDGHGVSKWAEDNGLLVVAANFIYAENELLPNIGEL